FELLPQSYFDKVRHNVFIREEVLKTDHFIGEDLCQMDARVKLGFTYKNTIHISSKLVTLALKERKSFDCGHGSFLKTLHGVIIHELTHIKDNAERISIEPDFQRIVGMKKVQRSSKRPLSNRNFKTTVDAYEF